jgi:hypothetical protein
LTRLVEDKMPDLKFMVFNLHKVATDCPPEKVTEILTKLQNRCHELHDALVLAEEFLSANCWYTEDMKPIYKALGKKEPQQ